MIDSSFIETSRTDRWWVEPLWTGLGFLAFVIYTTWSMLQGEYYWWSAGQEGFGGYLSPFYSPLIFINQGVRGRPHLSCLVWLLAGMVAQTDTGLSRHINPRRTAILQNDLLLLQEILLPRFFFSHHQPAQWEVCHRKSIKAKQPYSSFRIFIDIPCILLSGLLRY